MTLVFKAPSFKPTPLIGPRREGGKPISITSPKAVGRSVRPATHTLPRVRPQAASLRRSNRSVYSARVIRVGAAFLSIRDLRFGGVMSDPLSVPFNCPNCGAKYETVRVEAPPQWMADRDIKCVSCGGSLQGRHGMFVLKYFLVEHPRRARGM